MFIIKFSTVLTLFLITLTVLTFIKKYLTYKGLTLLLLLNNFIFLIICSSNWSKYIIKYDTESFAIKINTITWININYTLSFKVTTLSFLFVLLVLIISFATNVYTLNYFKYEERAEEFILLVNWFVFSMILFVCGNNFFTLILGWELIGLTSFLLINFWKFKTTTLTCSLKAFAFNKVSDLFLILAFGILWSAYKIDEIDVLLNAISLDKTAKIGKLLLACICLIICSSIKSAQIVGHLWLPDSMEAPVPASSLIHSATLVSAGIYLLLKFQLIFMLTGLLSTLFFIGSLTAAYGGVVAAAQTDVKKLLAYSTISHCGFIVASIGLNNFLITIIYLYLHGLLKAVTFFCAGSLIKTNNTQDMRYMGTTKLNLFNIITLIMSAINLGGLPFTYGYLYKQLFLNYLVANPYSFVGYGFCLIGMLSSVVYVYKLIYYSCFDFAKGFTQYVPLTIQNYTTLISNYYKQFTANKLISFSIIYLYIIVFYCIIRNYMLQTYIFYQPYTELGTNEMKFLYEFIYLKKHLISVYYVLFDIILVILVLNSERTRYFYGEFVVLLRQILLFFVFYRFVNNLLFYVLPLVSGLFV